MKIKLAFVGVPAPIDAQWPDAWPAPRIGDSVALPKIDNLVVRVVEWLPLGDSEDPTPYVYVVIGRPRP